MGYVSFRVCRDQCPMSNKKWFPAKKINDDDVVAIGGYMQTTSYDASRENMKRPPSFDICMCHQSGECKDCAMMF